VVGDWLHDHCRPRDEPCLHSEFSRLDTQLIGSVDRRIDYLEDEHDNVTDDEFSGRGDHRRGGDGSGLA
jgi:hypothetical protein